MTTTLDDNPVEQPLGQDLGHPIGSTSQSYVAASVHKIWVNSAESNRRVLGQGRVQNLPALWVT